jgi:hypothetical protein
MNASIDIHRLEKVRKHGHKLAARWLHPKTGNPARVIWLQSLQ